MTGHAEPTLHEAVVRARRLEVLHSVLLPDLIRYGERGEQEEVEAGLELYRRNRKRLDKKAERLPAAAGLSSVGRSAGATPREAAQRPRADEDPARDSPRRPRQSASHPAETRGHEHAPRQLEV